MLGLIRWIVMRLAVVRMLYKLLGGLAVFLPLAFLLKVFGLPVLAVLGTLALPLLLVLLVIGLPIFMVLAVGGGILALIFFVLTIGLIALKIAVMVVLPIWIVWQIGKWIFKRGDKGTPPPPTPATDQGGGI